MHIALGRPRPPEPRPSQTPIDRLAQERRVVIINYDLRFPRVCALAQEPQQRFYMRDPDRPPQAVVQAAQGQLEDEHQAAQAIDQRSPELRAIPIPITWRPKQRRSLLRMPRRQVPRVATAPERGAEVADAAQVVRADGLEPQVRRGLVAAADAEPERVAAVQDVAGLGADGAARAQDARQGAERLVVVRAPVLVVKLVS